MQERPMERLLQYGVESISNEELLSILLRTGSKKQSAKELATTILSKLKQVSELKEMTYEEFLKIEGIGKSKAMLLLSAIELGKRMQRNIETIQGKKFNQAKIIYEYYRNLLGDKKKNMYIVYT